MPLLCFGYEKGKLTRVCNRDFQTNENTGHFSSELMVSVFGSCHSFGVAVGLCGYGMCQMRGAIRSTIFLKMRRVGCIIFYSVLHFNSFKVQVVSGAVHLSEWEIFVRKPVAFFLKH